MYTASAMVGNPSGSDSLATSGPKSEVSDGDQLRHQLMPSSALKPLLKPGHSTPTMSKKDVSSSLPRNPHPVIAPPRYAIVLTSVVSLALGIALASVSMLYGTHHAAVHRVGRLPGTWMSRFRI